MTTCIQRSLVDTHFRGEISPKDERRMREHLGECAACKSHYRKRQLLAKMDPEAASPEDRLAKGLGFTTERTEQKRGSLVSWPMVVSALAVAAALVFVLRSPRDEGFHARGPSTLNTDAASESSIGIYRVSDRKPLSSGSSFRRDDELAFSYANTSHKPYVMIFGVDEGDRVYWFYPAWTDESENPMAVKTDPVQVSAVFPEAIKHGFQGSKLTIHGLFLDDPQTVRDVEAALRDRRLRGMQGAIDQTTSFEVTR